MKKSKRRKPGKAKHFLKRPKMGRKHDKEGEEQREEQSGEESGEQSEVCRK